MGELYSACIASFYLGQLAQWMAWFNEFGLSSSLLSTLDSNILNVSTMCIWDWAMWVLVNRAKLDSVSKILVLRFGGKVLSMGFLEIVAES